MFHDPLGWPNNGAGRKRDAVIIDNSGGKVRQIDPNVALTAGAVDPTFTLHRNNDRLQSAGHRDIQLTHGAGTNGAIHDQPMSLLKPLYSNLDRSIIGLRRRPL